MPGIYDDMQGIARNLLKEFNQGSIAYVETVPGSGPIGDPGPSTFNRFPVDGAARGVQQRYVDGTNIVQSDMQVTIAINPSFTPKMEGFIEGDGVRYKIRGVQQIPPFGTPVANVVIFRR